MTQRGAVTRDGCPVELYRLMPPLGEAELVHSCVATGARVLDLGCGVGRIAHELVRLGHEVVGVDESPEMLAAVGGSRGVTTVCSPIAAIDLPDRFDAVLLASHLVNEPDDAERAALLDSAARHLVPGGVLVAQWHPPTWFDEVRDGAGGGMGPADVRLADVSRDGDLVSATVHYRVGDDHWTQAFTARRLRPADLERDLAAAGLVFDRFLGDGWFTAVRT